MAEVRRSQEPPKHGPELWVERLNANQRMQITILSEAIEGFDLHYTGRMTVPCYDDPAKCPGCIKRFPPKWKGYLHVWDEAKRRVCILELTFGATKQLRDFVAPEQSMRGMRLGIVRGRAINSRLTIDMLPAYERVTGNPLAPAVSCYISLKKLWEINEKTTFGSSQLS